MSAMFEGGYRIKDGKIQELCEGDRHYDVDWGYRYEPNYWLDICDDTPENRKKYHLTKEGSAVDACYEMICRLKENGKL